MNSARALAGVPLHLKPGATRATQHLPFFLFRANTKTNPCAITAHALKDTNKNTMQLP